MWIRDSVYLLHRFVSVISILCVELINLKVVYDEACLCLCYEIYFVFNG